MQVEENCNQKKKCLMLMPTTKLLIVKSISFPFQCHFLEKCIRPLNLANRIVGERNIFRTFSVCPVFRFLLFLLNSGAIGTKEKIILGNDAKTKLDSSIFAYSLVITFLL